MNKAEVRAWIASRFCIACSGEIANRIDEISPPFHAVQIPRSVALRR
jgi:hypothetical protein